MENIFDEVIQKEKEKNSRLVLGLDPNPTFFPKCLWGTQKISPGQKDAYVLEKFGQLAIDAAGPHVVAVKFQLAYYEVYGAAGLEALAKTAAHARRRGLLVIADGKRGDIGETSLAYACAFLEDAPLSSDMVTVQPYLGSDSYRPFLEVARRRGKGVFVLVKTSNPSAGEIQNLKTREGIPIYQELAVKLASFCKEDRGHLGYPCLGIVVGANCPKEAAELRQLLPRVYFLAPGYGIQGGRARDLNPFFDETGRGVLVPSSRSITYPYLKSPGWKSFSEEAVFSAIRNASETARKEINEASPSPTARRS